MKEIVICFNVFFFANKPNSMQSIREDILLLKIAHNWELLVFAVGINNIFEYQVNVPSYLHARYIFLSFFFDEFFTLSVILCSLK